MFDPYKMVFINFILSILLLAGTFFYKFVYPKKKINLFVLLIFVSLLPLFSLLRPGDYQSGDFNLHTYRAISFYNGLKDGLIIPSWGDGLNATYGYPVFIFNYTFGYYIVSILHFLGISFISSMKIFLAGCFIVSGIFMYLWSEKIFKNKIASFVSAVFYLFAPYHLVDLHFRSTAGETAAFAFLPILLYFVHKLLFKQTPINILLVGMFGSFSYIAHSAETTFSVITIIIPYVLFEILRMKKDKIKSFINVSFAGGLVLLLSLFVWLPHIIYKDFTQGSFLQIAYRPTWELFYSIWRWGFLFQGPKGELSFIVGYTQFFVLFSALILLYLKKVNKNIKPFLIFWLFLFGLSFYLVTDYSKVVWQHALLLNEAQFSTRLLLQVSFCISVIAGYFVLILNKKIFVFLLVFITIGYTILNWGHRTVIPTINDESLINTLPTSTANYEGLAGAATPKWLNPQMPWETIVPKNHIEILKGEGNIKTVRRNTIDHMYKISAKSSLTIKENTLYFPGWSVKVDNKNVPIEFKNPEYLGIIVFKVPKGIHTVNVSYSDLKYYALSKKIDIIGILFSIAYIFLYYLNYFKNRIYSKAK